MTDSEFCVRCGATGRILTDGVCAPCAAERTTLVDAPKRSTLVLCPSCGARQVGSHWEREGSSPLLGPADLNPLLVIDPETGVRTVTFEEVQATGLVRRMEARLRVRFRGTETDVRVPFSVKIEHRTCPSCSRKSGHYYTALVQVRGEADGPRERARELRARLDLQWSGLLDTARNDWREAIAWREARPEGWDYYFVQTLAARSVARLAKQRLGASIKESATLFGRKDGVDIYRVTFAVRLPPPKSGAAAVPASGRR